MTEGSVQVRAGLRAVVLKHCVLLFSADGCTVVFDADGSKCEAKPHTTPHYHVIAHRCGYGDDVLAYCQEHEFAHCFLEERVHDRPSRVLWGLAHGAPLSWAEALYEEGMAQALQRWLRANERPIIGGVDWDGLKRDALWLLDGDAA